MRAKRDASVLALTTFGSPGINMLRFYLLLVSLGLSLPIANFVFGVAPANPLGLRLVTILVWAHGMPFSRWYSSRRAVHHRGRRCLLTDDSRGSVPSQHCRGLDGLGAGDE